MCDQYMCSSGDYRRCWILVRHSGSAKHGPVGSPSGASSEEEEKVRILRRGGMNDTRPVAWVARARLGNERRFTYDGRPCVG